MYATENNAQRAEIPEISRSDLTALLTELFKTLAGKDRCRAALSHMGLVPDGKTPVVDLVPAARWGEFIALVNNDNDGVIENVVEHPTAADFRAWAKTQDKTLLSLVLRDYGGTNIAMVPVEQRQKFRADVESLDKPHPVDSAEVRVLAEQLRAIAGDLPGDFVFATIDLSEKITHYAVPNGPGAVEQIVELVEHVGAGVGINVYYAAAMFKTGTVTTYGGRTKENVVAVLGAVCDFDGKHDPSTRAARLPLTPGSEIESSPGNIHTHFWFDTPQGGAAIEPTLYALASVTGADDCKSIEHLWRMPGTRNWPTPKKVEAGRSILPFRTRWLSCPEAFDRVNVDDLRAAILAKDGAAFTRSTPVAGTGSTADPFDWDQRIHPDVKAKDPILTPKLAMVLAAGTDRSKSMWRAIRDMRQYRNASPNEIFAALSARGDLWAMGHYTDKGDGGEASLRADIQRAFQKKDRHDEDTFQAVYRHAVDDPNGSTAGSDEPAPWERPVIKIQPGYEGALMQQMDSALAGSGADIFQAGGQLVRLMETKLDVRGGAEVSDIGVVPFRHPVTLREHFAAAAQFQTWDGRNGDWKTGKLPEDALAAYLHRREWKLRTLSGFITAPTLRPDGSLLSKPGYDANTGLFFDPRGTAFPPIPDAPSRDDARAALAVFDELIGEFPFADAAARSVALAAFLTAVTRRTMPTAPLFGIDATAAGSGKGLLADTVSIVGVGRKASAVSVGSSEEELEKRLGALFMQGEGFIVLDNVSAPIESDALCTILTQELYQPRILGQSTMPKVRTAALILTTGNGLRFHGDMGRRALRCLIDPKTERPDLRRFEFDPTQRAAADRGRYVAAALTVLRAYQTAGSPTQGGKPMGSFGVWTCVVRDPLLWLGEADPVATVTEQMDDPRREQHVTVLSAWEASLGLDQDVTCGGLVEAATNPEVPGHADLRKAILAVAAQQGGRGHGEVVSLERLGRWIQRYRLKVAGGRRIATAGLSRSKAQQYRLERVK